MNTDILDSMDADILDSMNTDTLDNMDMYILALCIYADISTA